MCLSVMEALQGYVQTNMRFKVCNLVQDSLTRVSFGGRDLQAVEQVSTPIGQSKQGLTRWDCSSKTRLHLRSLLKQDRQDSGSNGVPQG